MEDTSKQATNDAASALVAEGLSALGQRQGAKATATTTGNGSANAAPPGGAADRPGGGTAAAAAGATPPPAAAAPEGFVAKADVERMIADAMAKHTQTQEGANVRERFIREKMADLPLKIQELMPKTGDADALARAEQGIRRELGEWFKREAGRLGLPAQNLTGGVSTGHPPRAVMTAQGMTATQSVMAGLKPAKQATSDAVGLTAMRAAAMGDRTA